MMVSHLQASIGPCGIEISVAGQHLAHDAQASIGPCGIEIAHAGRHVSGGAQLQLDLVELKCCQVVFKAITAVRFNWTLWN